jgi:hypothetical protein
MPTTLLPPRGARSIPIAEYPFLFSKIWSRLSRRFFKLEAQDLYLEPDEPSYVAFEAGDQAKAVELFRDRLSADDIYLRDVTAKNLDYTRVRIIRQPLSEYLSYELRTYQLSARYAQRIFIIGEQIASELGYSVSHDMMLFDDYAQFILAYDSGGSLTQVWLTEDLEVIRLQNDLADALVKHSLSLGLFERENNIP